MRLAALLVLAVIELTGLSSISNAPRSLTQWAAGRPDSLHQVKTMPHERQALPVKTGSAEINLGAVSALAVDVSTNAILYEKNSDQQVPIASITKLVTAMVIVASHDLDEIVPVGQLPAYQPEAVQLGLAAGQKFKLGELLKAALIPSANDAADALAIYDSGSVEAFTQKMNTAVKHWGIEDTHFSNTNGLSDADNYASARSLIKLGKIALSNPSIRELAGQDTDTAIDEAGQAYPLTTTNQLLNDGRFSGIKTGYTPGSGQSFLGLANVNGHQVATVVLNSPDRFGETLQLINHIEQNWTWL